MIPCRNDLPQYLSGEGVEIGVHLGYYSERLLRDGHFHKLTSVDPWTADGGLYATQAAADAACLETRRRLSRFGERSSVWRMTGQSAANLFVACQLDFVYIDSSHEYRETCEELDLWWPLLKPNGLLAGHDYCNGEDVRRAVDRFAAKLGIPVETTVQDSDWATPVNSWMIRKP